MRDEIAKFKITLRQAFQLIDDKHAQHLKALLGLASFAGSQISENERFQGSLGQIHQQMIALRHYVSDFLFPLQPPPPLPRQTPRLSHPEKLDFGPFRLRLAPFRLRLAPFRVCFRSFSGCWVGPGWVGERGFCKGKEYHYTMSIKQPMISAKHGKYRCLRTTCTNLHGGALKKSRGGVVQRKHRPMDSKTVSISSKVFIQVP